MALKPLNDRVVAIVEKPLEKTKSGILLGEAFSQAIGDKKGIKRMAHAIVPMDESVATVAIDISGRSYCNMKLDFKNDKILLSKFFYKFVYSLLHKPKAPDQSFKSFLIWVVEISGVRGR